MRPDIENENMDMRLQANLSGLDAEHCHPPHNSYIPEVMPVVNFDPIKCQKDSRLIAVTITITVIIFVSWAP